MGGRGSNRWSEYRRRKVANDSLAFCVTVLRQLKLTDQTNYLGTYTWTLADGPCELHFNIRPNYEGGLWLYLEHVNIDSSWFIDQQVNMHMTAIPRGGRRWWMECPIVKGHAGGYPLPCGKRCAVLYLSTKLRKFGCRKCLDLTYRSSQTHNKKIDKFRKDPEAYRRAVLKAYEKMESLDEQMKDLRKDGLFKGVGQKLKGPGSQGNSGGSTSGA